MEEWEKRQFPLELIFTKNFCKYRIDGTGDEFYNVRKEFEGYVCNYIDEEELRETFPSHAGYYVEQCVSEEEEVRHVSAEKSSVKSGDNVCWCFTEKEGISRIIVDQ